MCQSFEMELRWIHKQDQNGINLHNQEKRPVIVATPLLEECEDVIHIPQNGDLGVLWDS